MLRVQAQFSDVLAMVGGDDDRHIVINALLSQQRQNPADLIIRIFDAAIVVVHKGLELLERLHLTRMPGAVGRGFVRPHTDLVDTVGTHVQQMLRKDLRRDPIVTKWNILIGVSVGKGRAVGGVGIPVMDMQRPVFHIPVALEPVQGHLGHFFSDLTAASAHVVAFIQPGIEPPGRMTLRESGDRRGLHPRLAELHKQTVRGEIILEMSGDTLGTHIRRSTAVTHNACVDPVHTADQGCPGRKAGCVGAVIGIKPYAFRRHRVDIGVVFRP